MWRREVRGMNEIDFSNLVNEVVEDIKGKFIDKMAENEGKYDNLGEAVGQAFVDMIDFNIELTAKSLEKYHQQLIASLNSSVR
jgi:predicted SprT family Zn-dependent metalloprotease